MNTGLAAARGPNPRMAAVLAVLPVIVAGAIATAVTIPNVPGWYRGLAKSPVVPPDSAFGPAWTILYVLMAIAFWRVLVRPAGTPGRMAAIGWFLLQIVLNALWSVLFFGAHAPGLALLDVVLLDLGVILTIPAFGRVDRLAAGLLVPYAAWILFATYLNVEIVRLNP